MPKPNKFEVSEALGFEATHGLGVSVTAYTLTGTTVAKNVFGTKVGFNGVITGVIMNTKGATAASVALVCDGTTVCTLVGSDTAGGIVGASSALVGTTLKKNGTLTIASNSAADISTVWISYKLT